MSTRMALAAAFMGVSLTVATACSSGDNDRAVATTSQAAAAEQKTAASNQITAQMRLNAVRANLTTMTADCEGGDEKMCADLERVLGQVCAEPGMESACTEFGGTPSLGQSSPAEPQTPAPSGTTTVAN